MSFFYSRDELTQKWLDIAAKARAGAHIIGVNDLPMGELVDQVLKPLGKGSLIPREAQPERVVSAVRIKYSSPLHENEK